MTGGVDLGEVEAGRAGAELDVGDHDVDALDLEPGDRGRDVGDGAMIGSSSTRSTHGARRYPRSRP